MTKYIFVALIVLTSFFSFSHDAEATAYYIDFARVCGTCDGLATTTSFTSLDAFTEVARTAGDIAFVRRGTASTTNVTDLSFTSDGTVANPLIISADYDNLWNDFASSTQTYTVAVATSTFTASAAQSEIIVGEWVYVDGDCAETYNSTVLNQCEFAYEVATVASTSISFYLPYKGNQTGTGHTLRILSQTTLGSNPQWNVATGDFQWVFNLDDFWLVKGLDIRGTDTVGNVGITSSRGHSFFDVIFTGNGVTSPGLMVTADKFEILVNKSRFFSHTFAIGTISSDVYGSYFVKNSEFDGASVANSVGFTRGSASANYGLFLAEDSYFRNFAGVDVETINKTILRNTRLLSTTKFVTSGADTGFLNNSFYLEDYISIGSNQYQTLGAGTNVNAIILQSTTTVTRSGGGATSIRVIPTTNTTSIWDFNKIKLFEYPIYTNTTSRQYDVYFSSTSTSAWTADPLNTELWIECEYWAHDTNATSTRKIKKSTGVLDFNGSTAWQALSVTCVPTQTGILYLRGWYAKTKEASVMNEFFVDGTPVIQ